MRWIVFLPLAVIFAGLESGIGSLFTISWMGAAAPSLAAVLVAFVALQASPRAALWAAWCMGLLLDVAPGSGGGGTAAVVLGPHALGMTAAAWIVLVARGLVFRTRLPTLVAASSLVAAASALAVTSFKTLRFWLPWTEAAVPQPAVDVLLRMCGDAVATGVLGIVVGGILLLSSRLWRFDASPGRLDYAGRRGG